MVAKYQGAEFDEKQFFGWYDVHGRSTEKGPGGSIDLREFVRGLRFKPTVVLRLGRGLTPRLLPRGYTGALPCRGGTGLRRRDDGRKCVGVDHPAVDEARRRRFCALSGAKTVWKMTRTRTNSYRGPPRPAPITTTHAPRRDEHEICWASVAHTRTRWCSWHSAPACARHKVPVDVIFSTCLEGDPRPFEVERARGPPAVRRGRSGADVTG